MAYKPSDKAPEDRSCPSPESTIDSFLKTTKYRKPSMFPADPWQAARWWMAHQCPADDFTEGASPPVTKGGSWSTPYHDRLIYALRKFMKLKAFQQVYIIDGIEKGTPWKGEDFDLYQEIIKESGKMAGNKEAYIEEGFKAMHRALRGMAL